MICVHDFPHGEVLVKVGVMEFGLKQHNILVHVMLYDISSFARWLVH